jgi:DHA1 family bicyclomycin/chloramphenicol resistance-like MFS transporter
MASVVVFVAFLAIVMAFGVEAMLPAFDEIDDEFGFSDRGLSISLLVTMLLIGMGLGMLVWGPVSDRFGRRPVLVAGLVLYGIGAIGSALAPNIELLLLARAVWGFGAASPSSLRYAIARDLYEGDRMARVVTIATAVFLIGPLLMPIVGELILTVGTWETIAFVGVGVAAVAAFWSVRFGETLARDARRPLRFGPLLEALGMIARTPQSAGMIVASMFFFASFFVWLGSAQPIIDKIFGRDQQFIWFFGVSGLGMSATLIVTDRWIARVGTRNVAIRAAMAFVVVCAVGLAATLIVGGLSLWPWFAWVMVINALSAVMGPVCSALALDPVGEIAGVTSSVLGFAALGPGAVLAAIVDARIEDTVTPMIVGSTVFGLLGLLSIWLSQPSSSGISALRRPMKSSISSSTAESIGGAS